MSHFVVVIFPDTAIASEGNKSLYELRANGMKVYGSAVLGKDSKGRISVLDRVADSSHATAVAALIGALAGLPAGPLGAAMGAVGGALIGMSADLTDRGVGRQLAERVSHALGSGKGAIVVDTAPEEVLAFETRMKALGGTVVYSH